MCSRAELAVRHQHPGALRLLLPLIGVVACKHHFVLKTWAVCAHGDPATTAAILEILTAHLGTTDPMPPGAGPGVAMLLRRPTDRDEARLCKTYWLAAKADDPTTPDFNDGPRMVCALLAAQARVRELERTVLDLQVMTPALQEAIIGLAVRT